MVRRIVARLACDVILVCNFSTKRLFLLGYMRIYNFIGKYQFTAVAPHQ
jgi:hypothetical protein